MNGYHYEEILTRLILKKVTYLKIYVQSGRKKELQKPLHKFYGPQISLKFLKITIFLTTPFD